MEKSPVASPEVVAKAQRAWGLTRNAIKAGIAFGDAGKTPSKRISVHHVVEAREPFFKLVLLSMKSIMEAQDSDASMQQQLVTRWQLAPPNNKTSSGSSSDEISNKSVFLLKVSYKIQHFFHHQFVFILVVLTRHFRAAIATRSFPQSSTWITFQM